MSSPRDPTERSPRRRILEIRERLWQIYEDAERVRDQLGEGAAGTPASTTSSAGLGRRSTS
jgi:hypothetical protein